MVVRDLFMGPAVLTPGVRNASGAKLCSRLACVSSGMSLQLLEPFIVSSPVKRTKCTHLRGCPPRGNPDTIKDSEEHGAGHPMFFVILCLIR